MRGDDVGAGAVSWVDKCAQWAFVDVGQDRFIEQARII